MKHHYHGKAMGTIDVLVTDGGVLHLNTEERDALRVECSRLHRALIVTSAACSVLLAGLCVTLAVVLQ